MILRHILSTTIVGTLLLTGVATPALAADSINPAVPLSAEKTMTQLVLLNDVPKGKRLSMADVRTMNIPLSAVTDETLWITETQLKSGLVETKVALKRQSPLLIGAVGNTSSPQSKPKRGSFEVTKKGTCVVKSVKQINDRSKFAVLKVETTKNCVDGVWYLSFSTNGDGGDGTSVFDLNRDGLVYVGVASAYRPAEVTLRFLPYGQSGMETEITGRVW